MAARCRAIMIVERYVYHQFQCACTVHLTAVNQAGHNKWSKIKRKKAVADRERSKYVAKLASQISSAVRIGGADTEVNLPLSGVISRAKTAGVPKATIESAIRAGTSKQMTAETLVPVLYEGRGPSGYLMLIEALTENRKRTRPEIRHILERNGGVLGEPGSSSFMFEHKGMVRVPREELSSSTAKLRYSDPLELAIDVGAEDVISYGEEEGGDDECYQLKCEPNHLKAVSDAVKEKGFSVSSATLEYIPKSYVSLDHQAYDKATKLIDLLSSHADVMEVYDNFSLQAE